MRSLWSPDGDGRASRFVVRPPAAGELAGRHQDRQVGHPAGTAGMPPAFPIPAPDPGLPPSRGRPIARLHAVTMTASPDGHDRQVH